MPLSLKVYNTFRSRWCGAYLQSKGIRVIPTVAWGEPNTFWFCFDGIEKGSIVAVSTLGVRKEKALFMQGYNELVQSSDGKIYYTSDHYYTFQEIIEQKGTFSMNNKLSTISTEEEKNIRIKLNNKSLIIEIDGTEINSWDDYWNAISKAFSFPKLPDYLKPDYHSYYDIMTDLSWLETDNITLFIKRYDCFLKDNRSLKDDIIRDFNDYLLPFWDKEAEKTVVGGKRKSFCVFLVS